MHFSIVILIFIAAAGFQAVSMNTHGCRDISCRCKKYATEFACTRYGGIRQRCQKTCRLCGNASLLPKKIGPCEKIFPRYKCDNLTGKCIYFGWGGCQPNANNFHSKAECKTKCEKRDAKEKE